MRILLKLELDCAADAAWRAIRSPAVFRAVSAPFTTFDSLEPGGFPDTWTEGLHLVRAKAFGAAVIGEQTIDLTFRERDDVRSVRDTGRGLSGPLSAVTRWEHTMAVSALPGARTLFRDQLIVEAGALTPLLWIGFWAFWQWRGIQLKRLSHDWK
ncbi:MAG: hypothetical protein ACOH10_14800 [Rhodoglobus sp.]